MQKKLRNLFQFAVIITIIFLGHGSVNALNLKEKKLQAYKDKFDFKFTLYDGETIQELIPSLKQATNDPELLRHIKYLHLAGHYKGSGIAAYLTIDIKSPNNKQLKLSDYSLRLERDIRFDEVLYLGLSAMTTSDKDAQLDYEIKEVLFK